MKYMNNHYGYGRVFYAADGGGAGAGGGNGSGTGDGTETGAEGGTGGGSEKLPSFDDFLKGEGNQAEFDRRVQKAIDTAIGKAKEKWEAMTDDKLSEAEKLAKMTKEEKAQYLQQKKEKDLSAREADITRKELMAEAKNTLAEKKLPVSLADVLNYADADSCNKSISAVESAFQSAVEAAVNERLKGGDPLKNPPGGSDDDLAKQVEALMRGAI